MERLVYGAAKRLTFSLLIASALGGCAVYEPAYPAYSSYPTPAANYYDPYLDSSRVYAAPPAYVQPPLFFNFGFWGRTGHHHGGHHDFHHGDHHDFHSGDFHGFHSGDHHGFQGGGWRGHR